MTVTTLQASGRTDGVDRRVPPPAVGRIVSLSFLPLHSDSALLACGAVKGKLVYDLRQLDPFLPRQNISRLSALILSFILSLFHFHVFAGLCFSRRRCYRERGKM